MPSDLATALVSGNNAAGMMGDPALAAIAPQLQLAQVLSQQGLSTAPASKEQAWGRLAQAIAGVKVRNDALNDLNTASAGSTEEMGKIFPEGTPIGDGLRSQSPFVKMMAMQQAGKAMLLNSETKTLRPDQTVVAPATARQGGGVVAAGVPGMAGAVEAAKNPALIARAGGEEAAKNPALVERAGASEEAKNPALIRRAGGTEEAKNPALIARAGGEAAARSPYEAGGTAVVPGGPSGAQEIPITAATRAAIQPRAVPTETFRKPDVVVGNSTTPNKVQDRTLQGSMIPGVGGKPIETPVYQGQTENEKETMKEFATKGAKAYGAAQNLMGRLGVMDHNIEALGPSWMGAGADAKANFGKTWNSMLDTAGIKGGHIDPQKIATWEEFNKESKRAGMELINANFGGSREAASIIQMGTEAVPAAQQTYLGAKYNSASIHAAAQREIDLYNYKAQLASEGKSIVGADTTFNKEHPPEQYAMGGIVSVIPPPAVEHLRANPALAPQFDKQFGAGTSKFILSARQ